MKTKEEMLFVNIEQASFYDSINEAEEQSGKDGYARNRSANLITRSWAALRRRQLTAVAQSGMDQAKLALHSKWLVRKRGGHFLEIGCFRGSQFAFKMIEASGSYLGVELSSKAASFFQSKIDAAGLGHKAKVLATDFLRLEPDRKFDLIFAHGVLHHFANPEPVFAKIHELLAPDGVLLFTEPSQRNFLFRTARALYRPFQSDKAWEWPFSVRTIQIMERYFEPVEGFGWGRHSLPISVFVGIPVIHRLVFPIYLRSIKNEIASGWHAKVWSNSSVTAACKARPKRKLT
jgi:SAM-dependent methyltransferase